MITSGMWLSRHPQLSEAADHLRAPGTGHRAPGTGHRAHNGGVDSGGWTARAYRTNREADAATGGMITETFGFAELWCSYSARKFRSAANFQDLLLSSATVTVPGRHMAPGKTTVSLRHRSLRTPCGRVAACPAPRSSCSRSCSAAPPRPSACWRRSGRARAALRAPASAPPAGAHQAGSPPLAPGARSADPDEGAQSLS